jgi:uncharacterized phage protein gp47/JayE
MPFKRKTLSELRTENQQFMQAELEKVGPCCGSEI